MLQKENFMQKVAQKAAESPEFRANFKANPKSMMEEKLQFKLPDDLEIVVMEDSPNKIHIVLPSAKEELSELELSSVSGGVCWDYDDGSCGCT
jgi:hypothetical protein